MAEVVVTATKQGQGVNVSQVPISVAAFNQKDLDNADVKTVQDLFVRTPGVNFTRQAAFGAGFASIAIRGIQSRTSQPTTGVYIGDTPLYSFGNNTNLGGSNAYPIVFDLARVEVLRGPQGVDASLFADNLADAHPLMSTFHVGQRSPGDADHRYFANTFTPRTIGVRLIASF